MSISIADLLRQLRERTYAMLLVILRSGLPLFILFMLAKLALFNAWINVRYMEMTLTDVVIAAGTLLLMSGWTVPASPRPARIVLAVMNVWLTIVLYADLLYYRSFQDLISFPVLLQAAQVSALGDSIAALMEPKDALLIADWPIAVLLAAVPRRGIRGRRPGFSRSAGAAACAAVYAAGLLMVIPPIQDAKNGWARGLFGADWWNVSIYNVIGLYGFHAYDVYQYAARQFGGSPLTAEEEAAAAGWFGMRGRERSAMAAGGKAEGGLFGAYSGKNVIVVQVEALQSFIIGSEWNGQPVTPRLNALLRESLYFDRFYQQTAQGRTADADFAAQCSQHPLAAGAVFVRYADRTFDCLPGILKEAGYAAAAFHAYEGGFWNRNVMYSRMAFDRFYSRKHFRMDEAVGWSLGDRSFLQQAAAVLAGQKPPFYAFLITLSSHHPFRLPKGTAAFAAGSFEGTLFGDYLAAIHYADAALGAFLDRLKAEGLLDDAVIVIYGDHDNSITDWVQYEKFLGRPLNMAERHLMMREVPLIIRLPDGALAGTTISAPAGQIDIAPTLLHLLGVDSGSLIMAGLPLVAGPSADAADPAAAAARTGRIVAFRSGSFTDGRIYCTGRRAADGGTCYDRVTGAAVPAESLAAAGQAAEDEITASARAIEHDLIRKWRQAERLPPSQAAQRRSNTGNG